MAQNKNTGRVVKGVGGLYTVLDGEKQYNNCPVRGKNKKDGEKLIIGDIVEFSTGESNVIERILPRKNQLTRPVVSNIDRVVIVVCPIPVPGLELIDKIIFNANELGLETIICVNKSDLFEKGFFNKIYNNYVNSVDHIIQTCAQSGDGVDKLLLLLNDGLTCFAGQSAVGKSSLLNCLLETNNLQVGEISEKSNRGKHTTRHSEIFTLKNGGLAIDTPGFSLFDIDKFTTPEQFESKFSEYDGYRDNCKFIPCSHTTERDCAVKQAVERGELSREKYERYVTMFNESKNNWRNRYGK